MEIVDSAAEALRLNVEEQAFKAAEFAGVRVFLGGLAMRHLLSPR